MKEKLKWLLIAIGIVAIILIFVLIYQKTTYKPKEIDITDVEQIDDIATPEQHEHIDQPELPLPEVEEVPEVPEVAEPPKEEAVIGMNTIRRDPIITQGSLPGNNDRNFVVGDIESITDIVEIVREREERPVENEELKKQLEADKLERNKIYTDARLNAFTILDGTMVTVSPSDILNKKGLVVIYWSTIIDGGTSTIEKWIDYYNRYNEEFEFVFLNRGFEVEQYSNITEFLTSKDWNIPLYFDSMLSFAGVQDINVATEGFFINRDGYIMSRETSRSLKGVEDSLKGLREFYDSHRAVWQ